MARSGPQDEWVSISRQHGGHTLWHSRPQRRRASARRPGSQNTAGLDLDELRQLWLKPLWLVLSDAFTAEPRTKIVPHIWKWSDVRPRILEAGRRISAEEAERRVLMYLNPGLNGAPGATQTLFSGVQLIMPGEIAPTHRHVPSALRVVIEGNGAYTTVSGEKTLMRPGDFVTTPNWAWHDHGNETDEPMMWLDGLDMPFVLALNAMFYEELGSGYEIQPVTRELDDSQGRYNRGFRPHRDTFAGNYSPILNYRYTDVRETLALMERAGDAVVRRGGRHARLHQPADGRADAADHRRPRAADSARRAHARGPRHRLAAVLRAGRARHRASSAASAWSGRKATRSARRRGPGASTSVASSDDDRRAVLVRRRADPEAVFALSPPGAARGRRISVVPLTLCQIVTLRDAFWSTRRFF